MTDVECASRKIAVFPGRVRASSQKYFQLRDEGIISSAEKPCSSRSDGLMAEIPQKKRAVTCKPLSPPRFSPPAIGHGDQEYARAQGESAAGAPSGHRRAGKSSSPLEHPSRPGRPSAPETAPIGWDWRRLGGHGGGCLTSPHAAIPSFCKTTDPSGPAVDQSHLLGGVPVFLSWTGRREASRFALRAAYAVSPCLSDVSGVGEAGDVEIVKPGFAADRAQAAPRRREHGRGVPVEDDLGPQRKRGVFSARCSWRVGNPRGLSEFAFLRRSERIWTAGHEGRFNVACQNWLQVGSSWPSLDGKQKGSTGQALRG